jgi:hypothetical protein
MGKKNKKKNKKKKGKQSTQPEHSRVTQPEPAAGSRAEEETSGGVISGMRGLIVQGGPEGRGWLRRRRPLWEWALWIAGIIGLYQLVAHLTD